MIKRILKSPQAVIGLIMILIVTCLALLAPVIAPNNPQQVNPVDKFSEPNNEYPLGTDQLGRCTFSRLLYGARYSLSISLPVLFMLAVISTFLGTVFAYVGGVLDRIFTVICDIFMAFPPLVVVLSLVGALGQGVVNIMISVVFSMWVWFARVVRSYVMLEKNKAYVTASRIAGCSEAKILFRHIIPNIMPSLIVYYSTAVASVILMVSGFSFLGLGIEPGLPEWGAMLSNGKAFLYSHPMQLIYPGICIVFTAAAFNLFGEALRDIISPTEG